MNHKYEEPTFFSKDQTLEILNGNGSTEEKVTALVGAVNNLDDPKWLQDLCLKFVSHSDIWIAGAAINGLGDIARNFGQIDSDIVLTRLVLLKSERTDLVGKIEDAIDDIRTFIK